MRIKQLFHSLILAVAVAVPTAIAAAPPVALDIKGPMGAAPLTRKARVTVDPHPGNRWLCVEWTQLQGGAGYRSSCREWVGETAPKTHWQDIKDLSSGKWEVVAYVIRNDEQGKLSNRVTLHVLGPNYQSDPEE